MEDDKKRLNQERTGDSTIDTLTNLMDRKAIIDLLRREIAERGIFNEDLSVIIFDIDDLKKLNDSKGRDFGDRVLKELARTIHDSLRKTDAVGRYGGEEFLVVLPFTKGDDALAIADRIRSRVEEIVFDEDLRVTVSGGVKEYFGESYKELLGEAEKKTYEAKKTGKNKVIY